MFIKATIKSLLLLAIAVVSVSAYAKDPFDKPRILEPDIEFWRQVFADIDSNQAFLHDSRYLDVVYETINIPENATSTRRRRIADLARERYRKTLTKLAKTREGLDGEEKRILALWPQDITDAELREAAKRLRFQQGLADRFVEGLERSGAWLPYINEQLTTNEVPLGLAALPHVESSFNPEARSHVGASGLWQFTRGTGRRFMQVDHVVDARRDPFMSSKAAAELLAYNYSILESWPLAITAYNHGVAGMRRAVKQTGTQDMGVINRTYKGRTFGFASRNFYVAFLAALEVERNADKYFGQVPRNRPSEDLVFKTRDFVPAAALARAMGVSESTLKNHNPALLGPIWDGSKHIPRGFQVRIPEARVSLTASEILAAVPAGQRFAMQTPDMYHKVRRGESLSVIASRYNTSVTQLVALNGLKSRHRIRTGQTLRLPFAGESIPEGADTYTVRKGDSLSEIASRSGISATKLMAMNNLPNKNRIYVGQVLYLKTPGNAESSAQKTAAAKPASTEPLPAAEKPAGNAVAMPSPASFEANLADPNDYGVAADNTIEIQPAETLGHYADWLQIQTQTLRNLNGMNSSKPVVVGKRMKLDFSNVSSAEFTRKRTAHHRQLQETFFANYRVTSTMEHKMQPGESLWLLTVNRYKVPVWLLRQYNPDLEFGQVRPGMRIVFPRIERVEQEASNRRSIADAS